MSLARRIAIARSLARSLALPTPAAGPAIIIIARRRESFDDIDECYYTFKDVYGIATMTLDATGFDEVASSHETSKRARPRTPPRECDRARRRRRSLPLRLPM
jgi:hypothetical protein